MGKEVFFVGKSPEFRISQSSRFATENSVNNQPSILPKSGIIFDFTMNNDSARTTIADSSNYQPEIKPVITPVDLVKQARGVRNLYYLTGKAANCPGLSFSRSRKAIKS